MMKNFTRLPGFIALLFITQHVCAQVPNMSSTATANCTIFLDFDGHRVQAAGWQSGNPFICAPAALSAVEIAEIFNRVSEDFRPFNVNVTTDSTKFLAAPPLNRIRIIITPTSAWFAGVGGISYINSFTWGDDTPGFVFPDRLSNNPKYIAEACAHESGHTLGLSHQSKYDASCNLTEQYNSGLGSGETGWAPVMGVSYYKNMTGWNNGPTPYDCTEAQDNLSIITSQNGFTYRADDFNETLDNLTSAINPVSFISNGIIGNTTDKDAFKFVLSTPATMHIEANPYHLAAGNSGANLDAMVFLYNGAKTLIRTYNPLTQMNVIIDTALNADTYYVVVAGAGNSNTGSYGSLGSYILSGNRGTLPIHDVALRGNVENNVHRLTWTITADEPIREVEAQVSSDGRNFTPISTVTSGARNYAYTPLTAAKLYYRIKATSVLNQSMFSNIILLKAGNNNSPFIVSTFVQNEVTLSAPENYKYVLADMNGRIVSSGNRQQGSSRINIAAQPKGMYVMQLLTDNNKQTERIIKQ